jgi:hypothetical protein
VAEIFSFQVTSNLVSCGFEARFQTTLVVATAYRTGFLV